MKVLTGDQLHTVETSLKAFFPQSQQVYGCVFLINRSKSADPVDVLVDNWPDFTTILCLPQNKEEGDLAKSIFIFTKDEPTLQKILGQTDILPWQEFFTLGFDLCHEDMMMCIAGDKGVSAKKMAAAYVMRLEDLSRLPELDRCPLRLSCLDESHVDLVNRTWKFNQGALSTRRIRNMICNFPSCCLLDEEGKAVAWILTYAYCAMGLLYTVPEHRGRGYAKILISAMATRLHAQGYPVYCHIEEENHLSYTLFKKLGFTEDPSYRATWFRFGKRYESN